MYLFVALHKEVHPIYALVYMPVTAVPGIVFQPIFDGIQPLLCTVIYRSLVDAA